MRRRWSRAALSSLGVAGVLVACGSRTGLYVDEPPFDASLDMSVDTRDEDAPLDASRDADATIDRVVTDAPLFDRVILDVKTDCPEPPYCDASDPGYVWKCGVRIVQCSSIEQCSQSSDAGPDGGLARCVNPCLDTLGQDTSNGCEFYAAELDTTDETHGVCYAVFIVNQWSTGEPARIQVDRGGQFLNVDQFTRIPTGTGRNLTYAAYSNAAGLARDQIAIMFLSRDPAAESRGQPTDPQRLAACPPGVVPAVVGDAAIHGTGRGNAFHIKTNVPVVAYQMLPYGGGRARVTGATLLLPTNVWDTNYVAVNAYAPSQAALIGQGSLAVVAQDDGTQVTIRPNVAIQGGGGIPAAPAGSPVSYALNRGEYLQLTQRNELTGSPIQSNKPIAVFGSATLMNVPVNRIRADHGEQMLPPVRALGSEYVGVRYRSRIPTEESVPWRLVGVANGTQLTWEPSTPAGAPTTLNAGQLVEFDSTGYFVVRSQDAAHPFYMAQYMTGGCLQDPRNDNCTPFAGYPDGVGDAEFVNMIPPEQYLRRYTFFTDPTYPETNLVVIRRRDATTGQFPTITLDCAGDLLGFQAVGTSGNYQYARVNLSTGNWQGVGGCDNGVHTIVGTLAGDAAGTNPQFGVTIWGHGNTATYAGTDETNPLSTRWVSYGYPAGANIATLNSVVFSP
jgi:hypothetical protein